MNIESNHSNDEWGNDEPEILENTLPSIESENRYPIISKNTRPEIYKNRHVGLSVMDVFGFSIKIYFKNLVVILTISIIVFIPGILWAFFSGEEERFQKLYGGFWILGPFAAASVFYCVSRLVDNESVGLGKCLSIPIIKFFPILGVLIGIQLMTFVFMMVFSMVLAIPMILIFGENAGDHHIFILIYGFISFAPIIIVLVFTCLALPAVVIEDLGPIKAIKRSFSMTRGYRWKIFLTFMFIWIVLLLVIVMFSIVVTLIGLDSEDVIQVLCVALGVVVIGITSVATAKIFLVIRDLQEGLNEKEVAAIFE